MNLNPLWNVLLSSTVGATSALTLGWVDRMRHGKERSEVRAEEAAKAAIPIFTSIENLTHRLRHTESGTIFQGNPQAKEYLDSLSVHILEMRSRELRDRLSFIRSALAYSSAVAAFGPDSEMTAVRNLCKYGLELLGAYLRREKLPEAPDVINQYRDAIAEADEIVEQSESENAS